jgi:RHS repeat-associated protein
LLKERCTGESPYAPEDALQSVRMVTDSTGAVVMRLELDAWGGVLSIIDNLPGGLPYRMVGGLGVRWDPDTGLHWMRQRWYDEFQQRFISRDPLHEGNYYTYCNSSPTNFVDPSGLSPTENPTCEMVNRVSNKYNVPVWVLQGLLEKEGAADPNKQGLSQYPLKAIGLMTGLMDASRPNTGIRMSQAAWADGLIPDYQGIPFWQRSYQDHFIEFAAGVSGFRIPPYYYSHILSNPEMNLAYSAKYLVKLAQIMYPGASIGKLSDYQWADLASIEGDGASGHSLDIVHHISSYGKYILELHHHDKNFQSCFCNK